MNYDHISEIKNRLFKTNFFKKYFNIIDDISDKFIYKNLDKILIFLNNTKCEECECLNKCKNFPKGYIVVLKKQKNNNINFLFNKCEKHINHLSEIKKDNNFIIRDFSDNLKNINFDKVIKIIEASTLPAVNKNFGLKLINFYKKNLTLKFKSLYLANETEKFKSLSTIAFCNELQNLETSLKISYIKLLKLITDKKQKIYNKNYDIQDNIIEISSNGDLCIIDDLGKESFAKWIHIEIIYQILENRLSSKRPTIFISSLPIKKLKDHYLESSIKNNKKDIERFINKIKEFVKNEKPKK